MERNDNRESDGDGMTPMEKGDECEMVGDSESVAREVRVMNEELRKINQRCAELEEKVKDLENVVTRSEKEKKTESESRRGKYWGVGKGK